MDEVTFRVENYDDEGNVIGYTEHVFQTEGCLYDMVTNFKDFLRGMSFSYVDSVIAVKDDGQEVGSQ
jgi:hypothetical protein|tara:strand:+ start:281 stop:481 length:201 start_codon:yes stop_codon:yes gene_type:complete